MYALLYKLRLEKKNIFSFTSTSVVSIGASFLMTLAFANLVDPFVLGIYQYVVSVASIIGSLSLTGLNASIIRAIGKEEYSFLATARNYIFIGSIPGLVVAFGIGFYYSISGNGALGFSIAISTLLYLTMLTMYRFNAIYLAINDVRTSNLLLKLYSVAPVVFVLPSIFITNNPYILAVIYFTSLLFAFYGCVRVFKMREQELSVISQKNAAMLSTKRTLALLRFGFHQSIISLLNAASAHFDKIIIFQLLGANAAGLYFIAVSIPNRFRGLVKTYDTYIFSRFAKHSAAAVKNKLLIRFLFTLIAIIPLYVLYILFVPFIFSLLFPAYTDAVYLSQIYAITLFAGALIIPQSMIKAHATNLLLYSNSLFYIASKLILVLIGAMYFGLVGAIVGASVSLLLYTLFSFFQAIKSRID